ncbi:MULTISPECIES: pyruvate, phosphate dikinase [Acidithrix]|uniref:Pyruvate, phosphate dikinase n=1 Tax=Acidithrix ferrooxidans TaxID=1280514 RepID=A0A0D8HFE9_9ACTN|nr:MULTISPECIES: pyruvate, phosphate dikinase [Acidithrix]KJF16512.1 pyruvate, phosphate dikinase [Acidithrix ferrooxidans]CAG4928802.1 unnamed protein product [Acidithrix sp. C25]
MNFVFDFDFHHAKAPRDMRDLLGGKGANLAEMTSVLKLPVPPGFTISTQACREYMHSGWIPQFDLEIDAALGRLEDKMKKRIGDPTNPLLVSVRSGAKFSMPGMMDTVLNLGLNDISVGGLHDQTQDERFAYDSYRRFIQMYGRIVLGVKGEVFDDLFDAAKDLASARSDSQVPTVLLSYLVNSYKEIVLRYVGAAFPQDPKEQLRGAIEAVFRSWNGERAIAYRQREGIPDDLGTAVNVQTMVFGNRDDNSGTGVGFTRNPSTGEALAYGDFLVNAQGEDVVAGVRNTEPLSAIAQRFPVIDKELREIFGRLERHYRDMCDTEFTIEQGKLWMLQTRVGKRTGLAALKMAVDMTNEPDIGLSREEAVLRITSEHLDQVLHPQFTTTEVEVIARGLGASPGAAVGKAYFSSEDVIAATQRGERAILVRKETSPEDVSGMLAAEGIVTSRGGLVSHAAVVARGWGKPAIVGVDSIHIIGRSFVANGFSVVEGDEISLNGTTGEVILGAVEVSVSEPSFEFEMILGWADDIRKGKVAVRTNADTAQDAANARKFGAEGIGLCRTEHMFLAEDRLPIVRRMILAETEADEADALEELRIAQRIDFREILLAMDTLPVTVRLLDPPLHEFLPDTEFLAIKEASIGLTEEEGRLYKAARAWREVNPMLGTRGVRLGVMKPGLYSMQVRALIEAARDLADNGFHPNVEIMIPLTVARAELELARSWVEDAISSEGDFGDVAISIGTMIETPRAAICANEIAQVAEFFSFGTNDLTQMTFGFSRDDVEGKMMATYIDQGLLPSNPFKSLDGDGVGELVRIGIAKGRQGRPSLKVGICGEHGGDPASIDILVDAGVDYVSCSPFRVPIARLAAAQAVLRHGVSDK